MNLQNGKKTFQRKGNSGEKAMDNTPHHNELFCDDIIGEKRTATNAQIKKYKKMINEIMKSYNIKTYTFPNSNDTITIIEPKEPSCQR